MYPQRLQISESVHVIQTSFKLGGNSPKCCMDARNWQYWGYSFNLTDIHTNYTLYQEMHLFT